MTTDEDEDGDEDGDEEHVRGVREGWRPLVCEALAQLRAIAREEGLEGYAVTEVKQKLGGLRIYVQGAEGARDRMRSMIRAAQERADATCEFCGRPGALRVDRQSTQTLCDRHVEARR
jgi:hypothetical protein